MDLSTKASKEESHQPMPNQTIDLASYLSRINDDGPADAPPTLQTLQKIQLAHTCSIPFENLDVVLTKPIDLDLPSLQQKLIASRRGGYCFEQNGLFIEVLKAIGFDVIGLSGRVRFSIPRSQITQRTHLFAKVTIDGIPWLVDVGVGGFTPTAPIRMDITEQQSTPHDTRRIVPGEEVVDTGMCRWFHQIKLNDQWQDIYEFTGEDMPAIDKEVANWWTSTHPDSKFRQSIMAAIASPDGSRHTLSTNEYTHRQDGQVLEQRSINSNVQLLETLQEHFGITLPSDTTFNFYDS